jgi:hypothetical protein
MLGFIVISHWSFVTSTSVVVCPGFFSDRVLWKACIFPIVSGSLNAPNLVQCTLCSRRARPDSADLSFVVHLQKTGLSGELNYHPRKISLQMCSLKNRSKVCMRERCIKLAQTVSNCCLVDCTYKNFCFLHIPPSKSSLSRWTSWKRKRNARTERTCKDQARLLD